MTPEHFAYWMQGIVETADGPPNERQWAIIKDHLAEVFTKVTPDRPADVPFDSESFMDQVRSRQRARPERERRDRFSPAPDLLIC